MIGSFSLSHARRWTVVTVEVLLEREETKALEHQGRARGIEASQDEILGEGCYTDSDSQDIYNKHILFLYLAVFL